MENSILMAFSYVNYVNPRRKRLQDIAIETLCRRKSKQFSIVAINYPEDVVNVPDGCDIYKIPLRNSKDTIGNTRPLPYVKEIMMNCAKKGFDVFGFMNSDVLISHPLIELLKCAKYDAYICYRFEIQDVNADEFMSGKCKLMSGDAKSHPGNDAFFFRSKWFVENAKLFPDNLILGETEWDTCYREVIKRNSDNYFEGRELFHVYHDQKWTLDSPGAKLNTKIWNKLKEKWGI